MPPTDLARGKVGFEGEQSSSVASGAASEPESLGHGIARWWIALAILLAAVNLRPLLTSTGVMMETIRLDLGLSSSAAGVLGSIPTACMGIVPLLGGWVLIRLGIGRGVQAALLLVALGSFGRWFTVHQSLLFFATFLGGVGIALSQVLIPVVIKQTFPVRGPLVMACYTTLMTLGAAFGAAATPALAAGLGNWPAALGLWAIPAVIAMLCWPARLALTGTITAGGLPWRRPVAWRMAGMIGLTSCVYMSLLSWTVPLYYSLGWTQLAAAQLLTTFTITQVVASLAVPVLSSRWPDRRPVGGLMLLSLVLGLLGMALAPEAAPVLWAMLAGMGLGALFSLLMILPLDYSETPLEAGRLSAMAIGLGMLLGALGPTLVGALRDGLGFPAAMLFLCLSAVGAMVLGAGLAPPARRSPAAEESAPPLP
ncbi:MAG: MFS transporter [Ectothiorhodospiraceae bacterium]|nr:MFS transporter [Ectothiorhodospiraceae bacterium]